ncbi:hypothetical protein KDL01_09500 [Actinospica durhamensis]|uniref:Peptidase M23 n=1 Tax=Actinospica durhamensis TaxID=1508375 RepID=A0A941EM55_9ACTN|nr:hypothetical protein [Actinospica durhamensis]MBR7833500.1 hypothetical protein [Actinospica durhamensis]
MLAKAGLAAGTLALCFLLLSAAAAAAVLSLLTGGLLGNDGAAPRLAEDYGAVACRVDGGIHVEGLDLTARQAANAAVINQVALEDDITPVDRAVVIALATAMQESGLENLDRGDRDSLGLFQQRPSQGWGSPAQIMNPAYAAQQFYRHLQRVPGWWSIPLWQAAQAVQHSGAPTAYQKWQRKAEILQQFLAADPRICVPARK